MNTRPTVGITVSRHKSTIAWLCDWLAVWRAGATPKRIQPGDPVDIDELDGLVIGGGDDIGATLYGGEITLDVRIDPERDALEQKLFQQAMESQMPVLGICRGMQMINVARGGTLHADIATAFEDKGARNRRTVLPSVRVKIDQGSRLAKVIKLGSCRVNSIHHQAVNQLGDGLAVVARDHHDIVQAIEDADHPFLVGVQWHPEFMIFSRAQQRLFRALVDAVRGKQAASEPASDRSTRYADLGGRAK